jgi:thymidylate kinase
MFIEFLGVPGSGKTTLTPVIAEHLRDRGLKARTMVEAGRPFASRTLLGRLISTTVRQPYLQRSALWLTFVYASMAHRVGFVLENHRFVRHAIKSQLGRPLPRRHLRSIRQHFVRMMGYYQFLQGHRQADEIVVFDEGFLHRVTHLYGSEQEEADVVNIVRYLELAPKSALAVLVYAPPGTCLERIYARGLRGRLHGKSEEEVARFVANVERVVQISVRHLGRMEWATIEVDNSGDLQASQASLCEQLDRFLQLSAVEG